SELMVKQMRGEYKVKNEDLRPLYEQARRLAGRFKGGVTLRHVPRAQNARADALCNEALDGLRPCGPAPAPPPAPPHTPAAPPAAAPAAPRPASRPPAGAIKVVARGTLDTAAPAPGGEGTGCVLHTEDGDLELDLGGDRDFLAQAENLAGQAATVHG